MILASLSFSLHEWWMFQPTFLYPYANHDQLNMKFLYDEIILFVVSGWGRLQLPLPELHISFETLSFFFYIIGSILARLSYMCTPAFSDMFNPWYRTYTWDLHRLMFQLKEIQSHSPMRGEVVTLFEFIFVLFNHGQVSCV